MHAIVKILILRQLIRTKGKDRSKLIKSFDKGVIKTICECAHNALKGNVKLTTVQKHRLSRHKKILRRLCKRREGWKSKKRIINQSGGFLLPLLGPIVASIISLMK